MGFIVKTEIHEQLKSYFEGLTIFPKEESQLVRSSTYLNELCTRLFISGDTEKLKVLHKLTFFGFMHYNIYDLYKKSHIRMNDPLPLVLMGNDFDFYSPQDVMKLGFSEDDIHELKSFNGKMCAIIERLFKFEMSFSALFKLIDNLTDNYSSDECASLAAYMEYEFPHAAGALYLHTVSKIHPSEKFQAYDYLPDHGLVPVSYNCQRSGNLIHIGSKHPKTMG
jgi:hypothetical protein